VSDDTHGIDVEEDTDLETADDEDEEVPEGAHPPEPAPPEETYDERAAEVREQENVDSHRDEEPFES
jgi:hypothetical protein